MLFQRKTTVFLLQKIGHITNLYNGRKIMVVCFMLVYQRLNIRITFGFWGSGFSKHMTSDESNFIDKGDFINSKL